MNNLFTNQNNVGLIWDILSENPQFLKLSEKKQDIICNALKEDMIVFYEKYKSQNMDILDLNKKFLTQITHALKMKEQQSRVKKEVSFEESLENKKKELQQILQLQYEIPPPLHLSDEMVVEKLNNIDELMNNVIEKRKMDPISTPKIENAKTLIRSLSISSNLSMDQNTIQSLDKRLLSLEEKIENVVKNLNDLLFKFNSVPHVSTLNTSNDSIIYSESKDEHDNQSDNEYSHINDDYDNTDDNDTDDDCNSQITYNAVAS